MNINIRARHMSVSPDIQAYATEKIGRVVKYIDGPATEVEVELFREKNPSIQNSQVAEVTVFTKGPSIRAREASTDMHAAIDLVADKLERRVKKYREKVIDRHTSGPEHHGAELPVAEEEAEDTKPIVVKTKVTDVKPMSLEEAVLQMELLGHDFFIYLGEDDAAVSVLYRRRDGDYGLITPRVP
jgi:putative sigma-54 modulation protein